MSSFQVGRLTLAPPETWHEAVGDPVTNLGGAPIPAPRQAVRHEVVIDTVAADGASDTVASRLVLRRALRSMFNNTPLKIQCFLYVQYSDDPEQNGWYVPDFGQLVDLEASIGLASGWWKLQQAAWLVAGHSRTHREARNVWMKDLRTGIHPRDVLRFVSSQDFSALPSLSLTTLPHGAGNIRLTVNSQVPLLAALPAGRDGGICQLCTGQLDLATLSFERPDSARNLSDVIVYDRRGQVTAPSTGPDTSWEEVYGPDYPWGWLS